MSCMNHSLHALWTQPAAEAICARMLPLLIYNDCPVVAAPGCIVADANVLKVRIAVPAPRVFAALHKVTQELALRLRVVVSDVWAALAVVKRQTCSDSIYSKLCARNNSSDDTSTLALTVSDPQSAPVCCGQEQKRQIAVLGNVVNIFGAAMVTENMWKHC